MSGICESDRIKYRGLDLGEILEMVKQRFPFEVHFSQKIHFADLVVFCAVKSA